MKKLYALVFLLVLAASRADAFEVTLGGTAWCAWWRPAWGTSEQYGTYNVSPAALYGPALMIGITQRWSLSTQFLYGRFHATNDNWYVLRDYINGTNTVQRYKENRMVVRMDSDTSVGWVYSRYIMLTAGYKYMTYRFTAKYTQYGLTAGLTKIKTDEHSPGLGIGSTVPLGAGFYLLPQISLIYSHVVEKEDRLIKIVNGPLPVPEYRSASIYWLYRIGANAKLSAAYRFESVPVTLLCGLRYQVLGKIGKGGSSATYKQGTPDQFFGFYASVLYRLPF